MASEVSLISCGRIYNPRNWHYNPAYVVNRIYYIHCGTAYYQHRIVLKPGFLYLFRADADFRVEQNPLDPVDHVYFDFLTYRALASTPYIEIDPKKHPMLLHLLCAISEDFTNPERDIAVSDSYLELLLYYIKDYLAPDNSYSRITSTMLQLIHSQPMDKLSVNQIADDMNLNVNHIIRCFKREMGITPHQYIMMFKKNLAIGYMREGMRHTEIAQRLGFSSLSSFSYFFKHATSDSLS